MSKKDKLLKSSPNNITFEDIRKLLELEGFDLDRITGSHHIFGNVSELLEDMMGMDTKFVSIDKQTDDNIVQQNGFRKANSLSS